MAETETSSSTDPDLALVGQRIRAVREQAELSQQDFADQVGFSRRQVIAWETGVNSPPIALLRTIREKFNIDPEWVVMGPGLKPLQKVGAKEVERRARVEREVARLVKNAGLEVSDSLRTTLADLILQESPEDEKQAKNMIFKTLRATSISRGMRKIKNG